MSFSTDAKQELTRVRLRGDAVRRAQLAGLTHAGASLRLGKRFGVEYVTETKAVAEQIAYIACGLYDVDATLFLHDAAYRQRQQIVLSLSGPGCEALMSDCGLFARDAQGVHLKRTIPDALVATSQTKRAFLRGAFLGAGSVSNPRRAYHLEIVCAGETLAHALCDTLRFFACEAKTVRRKEKYVVYLKDGDKIFVFLALLGATNASIHVQNARTDKEFINYVNRTKNCDTANIGRTVDAAGEQIEAIHRILADPVASKRLSPVLRETAELRLNHAELSLNELAELAGIGKSGMNHRLQRLLEIARELP